MRSNPQRFCVASWPVCVLLAVFAGVPIDADAQLQQGAIYGTVVGPDGSPIDGAVVTLCTISAIRLAGRISVTAEPSTLDCAPVSLKRVTESCEP